jgi:hypothetical protein
MRTVVVKVADFRLQLVQLPSGVCVRLRHVDNDQETRAGTGGEAVVVELRDGVAVPVEIPADVAIVIHDHDNGVCCEMFRRDERALPELIRVGL